MELYKKAAIALAGAGAYVCLGGAYTLCKWYEANSPGYNNRQVNQSFLEEFDREAEGLEKRLAAKNKPCEIEISTDIVVHSRTKGFFDDSQIPADNDAWTYEVENALEGLDIYKGLGICFHYDDVIPVYENVLYYDPSLEVEDILESPWLLRNVILMEAEDLELNLDKTRYFYGMEGIEKEAVFIFTGSTGRLKNGKRNLGRAEINGTYAIVLLGNEPDSNQKITAHEAGHLFGLDDLPEQNWVVDFILDPFNLFTNLMRPGFISFSLDKGQIGAILDSARKRF